MKTQTKLIFRGWLRFVSPILPLLSITPPPPPPNFALASFKRGFLLLGAVLLSFSSLSYAAEQGEYNHYLGFGISGALLSDDLQKIDFADDGTDDGTSVVSSDVVESGGLFVWDWFQLDNEAAFSLMVLSVIQDESLTFSDGFMSDGEINLGGPLVAGKYFMGNGLYVGGGGTLLSLSGDVEGQEPNEPSINVDFSSDSVFAPTLVLGYRGLVSRFENSHFYIGADWIRTLPVDLDYEASVLGVTVSDTFEDLSISMIAVSFGLAF